MGDGARKPDAIEYDLLVVENMYVPGSGGS
jgi:hypothetical protein